MTAVGVVRVGEIETAAQNLVDIVDHAGDRWLERATDVLLSMPVLEQYADEDRDVAIERARDLLLALGDPTLTATYVATAVRMIRAEVLP